MTGDAAADAEPKATLRRLYRHPASGQLVAMESKARIFPKGLALLLQRRDRTCRTPYCNAPIRHHDHAVPARAGGPTSAGNGLGLCEACNYAKEAPGWRVTTIEDNGEHTSRVCDPDRGHLPPPSPRSYPGHRYARRLSLAEGRLSIDLVTFDAA